jgi:hypothetical protein
LFFSPLSILRGICAATLLWAVAIPVHAASSASLQRAIKAIEQEHIAFTKHTLPPSHAVDNPEATGERNETRLPLLESRYQSILKQYTKILRRSKGAVSAQILIKTGALHEEMAQQYLLAQVRVEPSETLASTTQTVFTSKSNQLLCRARLSYEQALATHSDIENAHPAIFRRLHTLPAPRPSVHTDCE